MRISDWSSDVCSSDLRDAAHLCQFHPARYHSDDYDGRRGGGAVWPVLCADPRIAAGYAAPLYDADHRGGGHGRPEERQVGKEGDSTCRTRRVQSHYKKTHSKILIHYYPNRETNQ